MLDDAIVRWSRDALVQLVPGTTTTYWRRQIPFLVARGALVKSGRGWLGRRSEIEAALLEGDPCETQTTATRGDTRAAGRRDVDGDRRPGSGRRWTPP
jgi:hypothetical protein